jgi:hypothetical protein
VIKRLVTELFQGLKDLFAIFLLLDDLLAVSFLAARLSFRGCRDFASFFPDVIQHRDFEMLANHGCTNFPRAM